MRDNPNQVSKDFTSRFEKLSFKDDVDISGYREALDYAFSNPDIKNIAIPKSFLRVFSRGQSRYYL